MSLQSEMLKIKEDSEKYGIKNTMKILRLYKNNQDEVLAMIADIYLKYLDGEGLNISDSMRLKILKELNKKVKSSLDILAEKQVVFTRDILINTYESTYYSSLYLIDKGIQVATTFSLLRPEFIKAAVERPIKGVHFSKSIWKDTEALAKRVISDVEKALIQGKSPEKLARIIKKDFGSTSYQAKRLLNTEVAKSVMFAQDEVYQNSGVVKKVLWDSTMESNTCDDCSSLDGQYFDTDDHPDLPFHPNCRCCLIPVVQGWTPTKKRENVKNSDGKKQIVDYTDVNSWKESKFNI